MTFRGHGSTPGNTSCPCPHQLQDRERARMHIRLCDGNGHPAHPNRRGREPRDDTTETRRSRRREWGKAIRRFRRFHRLGPNFGRFLFSFNLRNLRNLRIRYPPSPVHPTLPSPPCPPWLRGSFRFPSPVSLNRAIPDVHPTGTGSGTRAARGVTQIRPGFEP